MSGVPPVFYFHKSLAFQGAGGHAGHKEALEEDVGDDHRSRGDDYAGKQHRVVGRILALKIEQGEWQRFVCIIGNEQQRVKQVIPVHDEQKNGGGR